MNKLDNKDKNNLMWGIPFVIKDNFSTKDVPTTGSSNILKGYIPVFDAEAVVRLKNVKAVPIGKTTLDELAMGGTVTVNEAFERNPLHGDAGLSESFL